MDTLNYQISFILHTSAYPDSEFKVVEFEGVEEISRPYRYEILFSHSESDLDLDAFLNQTATLKTDRNGEEYDVHGVLLEAELISETAAHDFLYRVMLVPRFALMDYSTQNQVYQNQTVAEIIEQEIQAAGGKAGTAAQTIQLTPNDYRMDLTRSDYPSREYVVQYRETDFNFINRLMEHEGIFYFFEQDEGGERIVFADDNIKCPKIHEEEFEVPLQLDNGLMVFDEMTIKRFRGKSVSIPRKVLLKDYNYRAPHVSLQAEHDIDQACVGLQYYYGEHFKTPQEGDCLARVRSEEHQLKKHQFSGNSDCVHFHPGHFFSLNDHYNEGFNQEYLITKMVHKEKQWLSGMHGMGAEEKGPSYQNEFYCVPLSTPFRPARITPKPKLYGVLNAWIDGEGDGRRAQMDEQGRYKVVLPFDTSGAGDGKASRYIRMAQPYGGANQGMNFPLLKGTEVLWTCVDGDPDRPIIVGAVPNPLNPSVVTQRNSTSNVIRTPSGIKMEFNDGSGEHLDHSAIPSGQNGLPMQQQRTQDVSAHRTSGTEMTLNENSSELPLQQNRQVANPPTTTATGDNTATNPRSNDYIASTSATFNLAVPDNTNRTQSYFRLGATNTAIENELLQRTEADTNSTSEGQLALNITDEQRNGVFEYTEGNKTTVVHGNREEVIHGKSRVTVLQGGLGLYDAQKQYDTQWVDLDDGKGTWHVYTTQYAGTTTATWGVSEDFYAGYKFSATGALSTNISVAGDFNVGIGFNIGVNVGTSVNYSASATMSVSADKSYSYSKEESITAGKSIELGIVKESDGFQIGAAITGAIAAGVGMAVPMGTAISALKKKDNLDSSKAKSLLKTGIITSSVCYGVTGALAVTLMAIQKKRKENENSGIVIDKDKIELKCGEASLTLKKSGEIEIKNGQKGAVRVMESGNVHLVKAGKGMISVREDVVGVAHVSRVSLLKAGGSYNLGAEPSGVGMTQNIVSLEDAELIVQHPMKVNANGHPFLSS